MSESKDTGSYDEDQAERRVRQTHDRLPGQRDSLPPGALGGMPAAPQGDENRDPPVNAPTPPE